MKTFYLSDTHFGHANIIRYCERPFHGTWEMNGALTSNWNRAVTKDDRVIFGGDFCMGGKPHTYFNLLNGEKHLIRGNHDSKKVLALPWKHITECVSTPEAVLGFREWTEADGSTLRISHYPPTQEQVRQRSGYDPYHYWLYGHVHSQIPEYLKGLAWAICICVEMPWIDYTPRTWEEIREGSR